MTTQEFLMASEQGAQVMLTWIGFGTVVGLLAKAIMPGKDPGGAIGTMMMGIAGSVIGCGITAFFWTGIKLSPLSPLGFVTATVGAFVLLFFYKLLAGQYYAESEGGDDRYYHRHRRYRRRRRIVNDA
jgi:uncharacterized membrane protein YeaQ/YmgE (transglycosylase-associated protein family)